VLKVTYQKCNTEVFIYVIFRVMEIYVVICMGILWRTVNLNTKVRKTVNEGLLNGGSMGTFAKLISGSS